MALRLSGTNCWICTNRTKSGDQFVTYVYCQSKLRGLKCPLQGRPGAKPFTLGPGCLEAISQNPERE